MSDAGPGSVSAESVPIGILRIGTSYIGIPLSCFAEVCQVPVVSPIFSGSPIIAGSIDLRGRLVPVIDLCKICGISNLHAELKFAVVLRQGERLLAVRVEEVSGIRTLSTDQVQRFQRNGSASDEAIASSIFSDGANVVSVLAVDQIFAHRGVITVAMSHTSEVMKHDENRESRLSFVAGEATFSIGASHVYGTVPRQTIEVSAITSGFCRGAIVYHSRRIPVLDTIAVVGLGKHERSGASEVVILRCADDRLLGLAVDAIVDISRIDLTKSAPLPEVLKRTSRFLSGSLIREDGSQVFLVSAGELANDPDIAAIALLTDPTDAPAAKAPGSEDIGQRSGGAGRFLVAQAGKPFAIPLEQVTSIISPPARLVPGHSTAPGFKGYFAHAQCSVPLVDLAVALGLRSGADRDSWVLLYGTPQAQTGFIVERIFNIEEATQVMGGWKRSGPGSETTVQFGRGSLHGSLPVVNIASIAEAL